jgi:hypothetical protein
MFPRRTIACAIVCALLSCAVSVAPAGASEPTRSAAALAQERYYSSYTRPEAADAARAQERYYSSYGEPQPLSVPQSPAPTDDTPWLAIAAALAAALVVAGATSTLVVRLRRRVARVAA